MVDSSRGEALAFPPQSGSSIDGWLTNPALGRIIEGQVLTTGLLADADQGRFCGKGYAAGLTINRQQHAIADGVEVVWRARTSRTLAGISLRQTVELDLPFTSYVIAPGVVYDGNRFQVSAQPYCPYIPTEGVDANGPIIMADVPRITADTGYQVDLAANALTTPFSGVFDPHSGCGALVEVQIYGDWGVSGVTVATLPDKPIAVTITLPVQRVRRYRFCDWTEANEPGMNLSAGQVIEARLRIIPVKAANIPAFVAELSKRAFEARDRKTLTTHIDLGRKLRTAGDLVETKFDQHNWDEEKGFYRGSRHDQVGAWILQSGWAGGATTMRAMLQSPDANRRARAKRMLSFLCSAATPSGYFYGVWDGTKWRSHGVKRPGCRAFFLVRRPLEVGRDILFALETIEARGESIQTLWVETAQRFLDAVVKTEQKFGHLGYSLDPETGDVVWGDSAGGVFALEGLVRGFRRFKDRRYLDTAVRLAAYYRDRFLLRGFTCGGVGDALMAVDSESAYGLLAGLVHLHEVTKNPVHLQWAVEAADLFQTWVLLYDAKFPPGSPLQRLGIEPRGAVFANIQNQHGAPGIFVASGIELATLAERTGDERFLVLLREITGCIPQMVVRPGQEEFWGDMPVGAISERLMTMDGLVPNGHSEAVDTFGFVVLISANELPPQILG